MNRICKDNEPPEWKAFRETEGVEFQAIPELKNALLQEQGHLCAYCMRRIPVSGKGEYPSINHEPLPLEEREKMRVEHIKPRRYTELIFAYENLLACCPGAISGNAKKETHCDRKKDEDEISFDIFSPAFIDTLSYASGTGKIMSSNDSYDQEINHILGLNNKLLAEKRRQALEGALSQLQKIDKWGRAEVQKSLQNWQSAYTVDGKRYFKEYNGIVVWFLKRWLERNTARS